MGKKKVRFRPISPHELANARLLAGERKRKPAVWRMGIGHYGGEFVDVPAESFQQFKRLFPKQQFPRRVQRKTVMQTMTPEGEKRFHTLFPKSKGVYHQVFFGERTKGLKTLEKHYKTFLYHR